MQWTALLRLDVWHLWIVHRFKEKLEGSESEEMEEEQV